MAVFESTEQFYSVIENVFERVIEDPHRIDSFTHSNLVIRMSFLSPDAEILLDGRQPPLEVFYGPRPGKANLEFTMTADLLHQIWSGQTKTSAAFFSGKIKTKGNFMKAMQLMDLFRECERVYPEVAAEFQLAI